MAKASDQPLQPNPFNTYRDPQTGLWVVIQATSPVAHHGDRQLVKKEKLSLNLTDYLKNLLKDTVFE